MKETKKALLQTIWNKPVYYQISRQFDQRFVRGPWFKKLQKARREAKNILDVGCGEGTILAKLANEKTSATGVDISPLAIKLARDKHPHLNFKLADAENLPFDNEEFNFSYSVATLEHLTNPAKVIEEMIRVTQPGGSVSFWTLNFGSPFVKSPGGRYSQVQKIITGVYKSFYFLAKPPSDLQWKRIEPTLDTDKFCPDDDLVCEPSLQTLTRFLKQRGVKIIEANSGWENKPTQSTKVWLRYASRLANYLHISNLPPICYWGNTLFVIGEKKA